LLTRQWDGKWLAGDGACDAASESVLYYRVNNGNRADWRGAFRLIQAQSQPDDIVVTYWPELGAFYLDREFIPYEDIDVQTLLNGGQQYWFVLDAETIWAIRGVGFLVRRG
jgi:hypothetical protein